ncbi:hypothetical protein AUK41_00020 [Candidatus Berkelbacteria bacterium CG2_30_43_20]|nr:MAG: hypothetical protein AUK41_00020 [Candidatus Berkelbacteria bacterium CG2_30_43_20]
MFIYEADPDFVKERTIYASTTNYWIRAHKFNVGHWKTCVFLKTLALVEWYQCWGYMCQNPDAGDNG